MTPERREEIRKMYQYRPEVMEVFTALDEQDEQLEWAMAKVQAYTNSDVDGRMARAREVVETAREIMKDMTGHKLYEALKRYDEAG